MKKIILFLACGFLFILILATGVTFFVYPNSRVPQDINMILSPPNGNHFFGTDTLGRDLLARILIGARVSLFVGLVCAVLSFTLGLACGAIAGWCEGLIEKILMRFCDVLLAIPSFILVSVICLTIHQYLPLEGSQVGTLLGLCLGISATHWMNLARVIRGLVLEIKRKPFVEAAISLGGTPGHIICRHMLPNMRGSLLVLVALQIPTTILYESFISFIGLGIQPPVASWGSLVQDGWKSLSSFPHLILFPSLVLFLTVWSFHVVLDWAGKTEP